MLRPEVVAQVDVAIHDERISHRATSPTTGSLSRRLPAARIDRVLPRLGGRPAAIEERGVSANQRYECATVLGGHLQDGRRRRKLITRLRTGLRDDHERSVVVGRGVGDDPKRFRRQWLGDDENLDLGQVEGA